MARQRKSKELLAAENRTAIAEANARTQVALTQTAMAAVEEKYATAIVLGKLLALILALPAAVAGIKFIAAQFHN